MAQPFISVCIPSYERTEYLQRLLDSIKVQTFRDFDVIFTDDSKTSAVKDFVENYAADFTLHYYKNEPSLGTAKNMLAGFDHTNAQWLKILHDDDFFALPNALEDYANATKENVSFIFSGYNAYYENTGKSFNKTISQKKYKEIAENPSVLFAQNLIGPPSVMMLHNTVKYVFDNNLKWFTDFEYYMRILWFEKTTYINKPLISVSFNDTQVTNYTRTNPSVIIPEALYLLTKHGEKVTSNIVVYDSWWRVFRNMGIYDAGEIEKYAKGIPIPQVVKSMLKFQERIPEYLLRKGVFSKGFMALSYFYYRMSR